MSAPLFQQWLDFAKEDLAVAQLTFDEKHFSHACFLSQQAIEKALKAFLIAKLNQYPRIHNLTDLLTQCINLDANFTQFVTECATVDQYYIPTRYPSGIPGGPTATPPTDKHAQTAINAATRILQFVSASLTPNTTPST